MWFFYVKFHNKIYLHFKKLEYSAGDAYWGSQLVMHTGQGALADWDTSSVYLVLHMLYGRILVSWPEKAATDCWL